MGAFTHTLKSKKKGTEEHLTKKQYESFLRFPKKTRQNFIVSSYNGEPEPETLTELSKSKGNSKPKK